MQLLPWTECQFNDTTTNKPLAFGSVVFYRNGSSDLAPTWSANGGTQNPNPVPLDQNGKAHIWLSESIAYDMIVYNSLGAQVGDRINNIRVLNGQGGGGLSEVTTDDTATIDLSGLGTGSSPLTANIKISATAGNTITANPDGIYSAGSPIPTLQQVTTAGNSTDKGIDITANPSGWSVRVPSGSWIGTPSDTGTLYLTSGTSPGIGSNVSLYDTSFLIRTINGWRIDANSTSGVFQVTHSTDSQLPRIDMGAGNAYFGYVASTNPSYTIFQPSGNWQIYGNNGTFSNSIIGDSNGITYDTKNNHILKWNGLSVPPTGTQAYLLGIDSTGKIIQGASSPNFDYIQFNNAGTPTYSEGRVYYDYASHSLNLMTEFSAVTQQIGEELYLKARNSTGATIANGKVVYVSGATGSQPNITLADNTNLVSVARTIGVATHDIANNTNGLITTYGLVRDIDTSAFADGDVLYLGTSGDFTNVKPTSGYVAQIGVCLRAHITQGVVLVAQKASTYGTFVTTSGFTQLTLPWSIGNGTNWLSSAYGIIIDGSLTHSMWLKGNVRVEQATNEAISLYKPTATAGQEVCMTYEMWDTLGGDAEYARTCGEIVSSTAGAYSGRLNFYTAQGGALVKRGYWSETGALVGLGSASFSGSVTAKGTFQDSSNPLLVIDNGLTSTSQKSWAMQGNLSNGLAFWYYSGSSWSSIFSWNTSGDYSSFGRIVTTNSTASTSTTTGSIVTPGGIGAGGAIYAGGDGRFGGGAAASVGSFSPTVSIGTTTNTCYGLYNSDGTKNIRWIQGVETSSGKFIQDVVYSSGFTGYEWRVATTALVTISSTGDFSVLAGRSNFRTVTATATGEPINLGSGATTTSPSTLNAGAVWINATDGLNFVSASAKRIVADLGSAQTFSGAKTFSAAVTINNSATARQLASTQQTSATSTGAITWTLSSGANMDLTAGLTGAVTLNITAPLAGSRSVLTFFQGATAQNVVLSLTGVTWVQTGKTATSANTLTIASTDMVANGYYVIELYWVSATKCFVTLCKT